MPAIESVPPTVTERLLVSTGGMRPWRCTRATTSRQMAPGSDGHRPGASRRRLRIRPIDFMSSSMPSRLIASSDCEWAAPRVETVRRWLPRAGQGLEHVLGCEIGFTTRRGRQLWMWPKLVSELVVGLGTRQHDAVDARAQLVDLGQEAAPRPSRPLPRRCRGGRRAETGRGPHLRPPRSRASRAGPARPCPS